MSDDVRWDSRLNGETNPADFISEDRNNALVLGKDNKLFISRSQAGGGGGGYEPPDGGIPKRDLSAEVQGLLNRAQQALLMETDPVYLADKPTLATKNELTAHNTANTSHADIRALITNLDRVRSTTFNSSNGDLKFTFQDNSTLTVNIFISNLARDITYDATTKEIVITKQDGSQIRISVSDLVDIYIGFNGAHIQVTVESGNVIHAVLKAGTITEAELSAALLAKLAMKTDVATAISQHNADTTAHGIGELKDDIEDIKSDIEDLQADSGGDPMRGVATFTIGSDLLLATTNGGEPVDPDDIVFGHVYYATGDWSAWIAESGVEHGDYLISAVYNKTFRILQSAPGSPLVVVPQRLHPEIPTQVSAFENDRNFATTAQVATAKGEAIQAAADNTDQQVAAAKLATQKWIPAVQTKSALPGALTSTSFTYLCRVLADPTPSNNGVWQAIPIDANNHAANWTWFGDNQDFIDELELEEALEAERTISDNSYLGKTAKAADSNKLDGKTASEYATAAQGTKADNALPAASPAVDSARLGGHLPDYFATAAALEATEFQKGDTGPQGPEGTRTNLIRRNITTWATVTPEPSSFVLALEDANINKSYYLAGQLVINGTNYGLDFMVSPAPSAVFRPLITTPTGNISGSWIYPFITADGIQLRFFQNNAPVTVTTLSHANLYVYEMVGIRGPAGAAVANQNISSQVSVANNELVLGSNLNEGDVISGWFRTLPGAALYKITSLTVPAKSGISWDVVLYSGSTTVLASIIWINGAYRLSIPSGVTSVSDVFIWVVRGSPGQTGDPGFGVPPLPNESGNFVLKVTRTNNGTQGQPVWVRE